MNMTQDKRFIRGNQTIQTLIEVGKSIWTSQDDITQITLDEICRRCEVTKGAFYHHFASKDAFFGQINSLVLTEHMVSTIHVADQLHPDQPSEQICVWIRGVFRYAEQYRTNINLFHRINMLNNRAESGSAWREAVQDRFTRWQESGIIRNDISVRQLHDYLDSFTYGTFILTAQQYIKAPHQDVLISSFVQTLLNK